jgi:serine/threonine protein kinase
VGTTAEALLMKRPTALSPLPRTDEDQETTAPMDEEEKPPQAAADKTVIAPPPTERPQRTRTTESKLQPSVEAQPAPARTRTAERKLNLPPELKAEPKSDAKPAPPRTRTGESKLTLPTEAPPAPARTRTTERKLTVPPEPQPAPPRTRTAERKLNLAPELKAEPKSDAKQAPARTRTVERKLNLPPELKAEPKSEAKQAPVRTRTSEIKAVAKAAAPPPVAGEDEEQEGIVTAPTTLPETITAPGLDDAPSTALHTLPGGPPSSQPPVAAKHARESPSGTLPGSPLDGDDDPPATPAERTVMMPYPEKPPAVSVLPRGVALDDDDDVDGSALPPTDQRGALVRPQVREPVEDDSAPGTDLRPALGYTQPRAGKTQSAAEETDPQPPPANEMALLVPGMKLGGYQLIERIGAGAMGTVWLARQLSLDRDVAVKVLRPGFAGDPLFVYRFTQEAFAAAQLIHHNIVQVYDCGSEKQIHFFSMEYVDAQSLQSLVKRGPLDPEVAAGYVLQAARGLKFAHERNMVHRDIKPDNLLLNHNGVVKVGDLGLVKLKRPSGTAQGGGNRPVTYIGKNPQEYAMGTPAYMAPEQVENSAKVDARADIYSLGCTLYHLVTGRPPFIADSINKVMDMHVREKPVAPDERNPRVPTALSDIILKMMAKRLDERFQEMSEVIRALEGFLGIEATSTFSPREEHANLLESCVKEYNQSTWAKRRRGVVLGLTLLAAILTGLADWKFGALAGLGVASFAGFTWMASFIMRGLLEKGALFLRFRQFVFQAPLVTWLIWVVLLGGAGYGLYYAQLLIPTLALMGGALVFAVGFYLLMDRNVETERKPPVLQVEQMLRSMRLRGLEESSLRQFVCKYSGENWEAFFEALFGYEAKMTARRKWGLNERGLPRKQHSTWRDPLIRAMNAMQNARQHRRERRQLKILERKKLKAQADARAAEEAAAAPE